MSKEKRKLLIRKRETIEASEFLDIDEIKNNIIKLSHNLGYVAIVEVQGININLLEPSERSAIYINYRKFLSTLRDNQQIQIVIQSIPVNYEDYYSSLRKSVEKSQSKEANEFALKYIDFIKKETLMLERTKKRNLIILYYDPLEKRKESAGIKITNFITKILGGDNEKEEDFTEEELREQFIEAGRELKRRCLHVINCMNRCRIASYQLENPALVKLLYTSYEPGRTQLLRLKDSQIEQCLKNMVYANYD